MLCLEEHIRTVRAARDRDEESSGRQERASTEEICGETLKSSIQNTTGNCTMISLMRPGIITRITCFFKSWPFTSIALSPVSSPLAYLPVFVGGVRRTKRGSAG